MIHSSHCDVAIVGGGIAGLSAAWFLQQEAAAAHREMRYVLLEASDRWGGHICTEQVPAPDGGSFVVEAGPDSFLTQKPWALQLARALGMEDRLLGTNDKARKVYVLNHGKPTPMPDGVLLIVPTQFKPFALSPLLSPLGKLRMGMDLVIPARRDGGDETLADFVRRRLGREALDKIAEPLLSGIYNSEAEKQSLLATFPRFRALEEEYGSLTRGMIASRRSTRSHSPAAPGTKPLSAFVSFRGGTEELVRALQSRLTGDLRLRAAVQSLSRDQNGAYTVRTNDGAAVHARQIILATPAFVTADLLRPTAAETAETLSSIRYVSTGTISLAYRAADVPRTVDGFGLVVPRSERRPINAVTLCSTKFDGRAPEGYALVRVFFGGSRSPESMKFDNTTLAERVRAQLNELLGIQAPPLFHRIYRYPRSNAQYDVGHLDRVAALEAALPAGLYLTGSAYRGVGIPDCVRQSQATAEQVIAQCSQQIQGVS